MSIIKRDEYYELAGLVEMSRYDIARGIIVHNNAVRLEEGS